MIQEILLCLKVAIALVYGVHTVTFFSSLERSVVNDLGEDRY